MFIKPLLISDLIHRDRHRYDKALEAATGMRVLLATCMGSYQHGAIVESALAAALVLRRARVGVLLCDGLLPCCQLTKITSIDPDTLLDKQPLPRCAKCTGMGESIFSPLGIPLHRFSDYIKVEQVQEIENLVESQDISKLGEIRWNGLAIGEHALAGALRYYACGNLKGEYRNEEVARLYLKSSLLTAIVVKELISKETYDAACFHHGIYSPQGIVGEVCRKKGVRVVNWNAAYKNNCFIFSHHDTYHHTMIIEPAESWKNLIWNNKLEQRILTYIDSRRRGENDWIWFHESPEDNLERIGSELGIDIEKPLICLLTSVAWDAQLHYKSNAYPDMMSWIMDTIKWFSARPDLQLVIRVHPAEIRGFIPSRQPVAEEINIAFPKLPSNVFIIHPDDPISTYSLIEISDSVIIYNTKTGIEAAAMGKPVIVAGEAWIRGKGFSLDASSPEAYRQLLESLPLRENLEPKKRRLALKYAFHFFFRRMIPLPFVKQLTRTTFTLDGKDLAELMPGATPGLDVICDGILKGSPFIYPAENEVYL